jgi:outer membrane receptor protein involved in Fe transport
MIIKNPSRLCSTLVFSYCSVAALLGTSAHAQEEPEQDKVSKTRPIEEIIVTAQKREQSLHDVPTSLVVISGDIVEANNVADGFDLIKYIPGLGVDDNRAIRTTTLKTRGIGTFTNSIGLQSSNLLVIDGEVLPRQSMLNLGIADIERVEALRGPQGTLFGQNTSTGLIHYVSKRPQRGETSGNIRTQVTEFDGRDVRGTVNLPLNDNWAARFNAQWSEIDGWIDNTQPGNEDYKIGQDEKRAIRGQFLFDDDENLTALFRADYSERDTNCCSQTLVGDININFGASPIIQVQDDGTVVGTTYNTINPESTFETNGGPVTARNREGNFGSTENAGFSMELDYGLGGNKSLTYIGSYRDFELLNGSTFFNLNFPIQRAEFAGNEAVEVVQHELRLSSFGNEKLDWVLGLFYHDTEGQRSEIRDGCIQGNRGFVENGLLAGCYTPQSTNAFLSQFAGANINDADTSVLVPGRTLIGGDFTTNFENFAIFGQLEYQITDKLDATFGFRVLREESSATFSRTDLRTPSDGVGLDTFESVLARAQDDPSFFIRNDEPTQFSNTDEDAIYKAVLGYDFNDNVRVYGSYSTGYKGVSYFVTANTDPAQADQFPTNPEQSTNIEFGLRTNLFDNRLLFNFTYFDLTVEDYQTRAIRVLEENSGLTFAGFVNADEATSTGFEADLIWAINDKLEFSANYANYEAKFEDFANAPVNCPGGTLLDRCSMVGGRNVLDQSGLPFPNNAEEQFLGTLKYEFNLADGWDGNIRAVLRYEGAATPNINEIAQELDPNPSYDIWDLHVAFGNDKLRFNMFVQNLFDDAYTTSQRTDTNGTGFGFFPRDWTRYIGGAVQYNF